MQAGITDLTYRPLTEPKFAKGVEMTIVIVVGLLMVVLGGPGTLVGGAIGAALVVFLREYLSTLVPWWQYVLGAVYVLTILYLPTGLMGLPERYRQWRASSGKRESAKALAPVWVDRHRLRRRMTLPSRLPRPMPPSGPSPPLAIPSASPSTTRRWRMSASRKTKVRPNPRSASHHHLSARQLRAARRASSKSAASTR